jgi:hypothetical protein
LIFKRDLSAEEVVRSAPWLRALSRKGATVEIRPSGERHLQLLRNVSEEGLARAIARGFEPSLAVEVSPGLYDVWLRHARPGSEAPEEVLTYARRIARLEYGMSSRQTTSFGALAGFQASPSSPAVLSSPSQRTEPYSRAEALIPYLSWHVTASRAELNLACERLGLPTLTRFREQSPDLSPRNGDLAWARLALAKGLPQEQVLRVVALEGSRARAADAPRAVAYAARVLTSALRSTMSLGPEAAAAASLHALGSAVSLPVAVLRLAKIGVTVARRLVVGF